jgi:hypothetical protein
MNNIEKMEEREGVESIQERTSRAEDLEDLQEILEEIEEIKGTTYRKEESGKIKEVTKVYKGTELAERIDDIKEAKRHLDSITPNEGLRETTARLFVESSKNWNEFTYWLMEIVSDKDALNKPEKRSEDEEPKPPFENIEYYADLIQQAKEGVKTLEIQGRPVAIERAFPRKYGVRPKFIELAREQAQKEKEAA